MGETKGFLNTVPGFLRRPRERSPSKLEIFGRAQTAAARPPLPRPETTIHGGAAPVQPDFLAPAVSNHAAAESRPVPVPSPLSANATPAPRHAALPWLGHRLPAAGPAPRNGVVDLTAHRGAAESEPRKIQHALRAAFAAGPDHTGDDDAAFQVTLPRGVIRQIRVLAAEEGTTHRAVVLRALRAAGLEVPAGADVDRRAIAAKRRHQA